jgi:hypothetical protein
MRRIVAASISASSIAIGAGCTFLVSFDDVETSDAGTRDAGRRDARTPRPPPDPDPFVPRDAAPPAPTCDLTFPLEQVTGCGSFAEGALVCATNTSIGYPSGRDRTNDLVTCTREGGARASCVKHCPSGCAMLPSGFADQCDGCAGKPDGRYCGDQLGWSFDHARLVVTCTGGRATAQTVCPSICADATCR